MKESKSRRWWIVPAVLLLAFGHWFYWYRPRARPAVPNFEDLPAKLLLSGEFPTAIWIPFPHQNLGALGRLGSSPQRLTAAIAELAEVETPSLPRFGPFPAPPARELVFAADPDENRFFVAARVYPGLAIFARLAGRMARNPWLGGGAIELQKGSVEIRWQGTLWSARTVSEETLQIESSAAAEALRHSLAKPALTLARTDGRLSFLPDGWYRLTAEGGERHFYRLASEAGGDAPHSFSEGGLQDLFLDRLLSDNVAMVAAQDRPPDGRRALALFTSQVDGRSRGFALLSDGPARKLPLTGLGLAALLGDRGYSGVASGWSLLATSELNFRQGAFLVPPILEGLEGLAQRGEPLELALAGRPQAALSVLREMTDQLGPLGSAVHRERVRLLALEELLAPFAEFSRVRLVISSDRKVVRLELVPKADA